ncbi:MAG: hypothetical protein RQ885_05605 [Desulfurococcales archaeon]|nr:hypothetical protein [Desulfurococcales archaeon]
MDPRNTSRECPRCNLKMSKHKVVLINIRRRYLGGNQGMGFSHSNELETTMKVDLWVGVP